jgi:dTDP-4-amino-4,6-dideoxygalactose transaminase
MISPINDEWIPWFVDCFTPNRDELADWLIKHNIQTRNTYPEINKTPMYYTENTLSVSHYVSTHGLFLPSYSTLTDNEIIHICNIIKLFFQHSLKINTDTTT